MGKFLKNHVGKQNLSLCSQNLDILGTSKGKNRKVCDVFNNLVRHIKLNQENMEILEKISAINMCIALTDTLCVLKFFSFFKSLNIERSIIFIVLCC